MRSLAGGLVLAVVALSGSAINAQAAPQFVLPAQPLATGTPPSNTPYTELADVAMDAQGDTSVLFGRVDTTTGNWHLMSTYRPAGGSFSAPEEIAKTEIGQTDLEGARIAMNASGFSVATWNETSNAIGRPVASVRPPGGDWETRQPLTLDPGFNAVPAVDDAGDAEVVFIGLINNNEYAVQSTQRLVGSPSWSAAAVLSATPISGGDQIDEHSLDLALNGRGDAVAAWVRVPYNAGSQGPPEAEATARDAGSAWGAVKVLEISPQDPVVPVSIDAAGEGLAAPTTTDGRMTIDVRPPHGSFSGSPVPISGTTTSAPQLTEDTQGNAVATWLRDPGTGPETEAATRLPGGSFSAFTRFGPASSDSLGALGGDGIGTAVMTWTKATTTSGRELDAIGRPAGGAFGGLTPLLTTAATNDYLSREHAAAGSGDGIVVWQDINTATHTDGVYFAPYDGAGPQLRSLAVPATATAGQPSSFSVNPVDTWSSVASTSWNFGDGATGDGTSPTHAYAAAGTYSVQVTSTDSLGNQSTASRSIVVGGAPPLAPAPAPISLDTTPPVLSAVSMSHRAFAVAKRATAVSARKKKRVIRGSAFRYTLSEAATVRFVIQHAHVGQKVGRRCVKPKRAAARRKAKRCTYYTRAGTLRRARPAGKAVTPFSGRIGKRALAPGHYRVLISATDAARNASKARTLKFTILRG